MGKRLLFIFVILMCLPVIAAADEPSTAKVTLNFDEFIAFVKTAVWAAGIFLGVLAFLGVAFFGYDVRKARSSILDSQKELQSIMEDARALKKILDETHKESLELKEKFQQIASEAEKRLEEIGARVEEVAEPGITEMETVERPPEELIKEIIQNSNFEWTTINRLIKKTALSRDKILEISRKIPDVEIGFGNKTKDHIFKIKER